MESRLRSAIFLATASRNLSRLKSLCRTADSTRDVSRGVSSETSKVYLLTGSIPIALITVAAAGPVINEIHAAPPSGLRAPERIAALMTILSVEAGGNGERKTRPGTERISVI